MDIDEFIWGQKERLFDGLNWLLKYLRTLTDIADQDGLKFYHLGKKLCNHLLRFLLTLSLVTQYTAELVKRHKEGTSNGDLIDPNPGI